MDPENSLKRPSEDSENAQSPSKQAKLDTPDYQDLLTKVQSLERENKAQSNTISAMNNKLDKIVRLLSDLTEKEASMSKNVSNLNKLLEKQAEKSKPNATKSMGVFLQNLQKDESKNQSNGHNKDDKVPIENKPIVRQPVNELDELKWASNSYFIGDGLIGRLDKVPDIKEKLDKMKKELNLRLKSKDKERVCYLYDLSRKQLKAPLHNTVSKVVLSIGSQDLFEDSLLTLKQASLEEVKQANKSELKKKATHIKALIEALMGKKMEKKVVYIIPATCVQRKEVFEHFEEIITETLKDLPFPNFKLLNFPELMYNQSLQDDLLTNSKIFLSISDVQQQASLILSKNIWIPGLKTCIKAFCQNMDVGDFLNPSRERVNLFFKIA